MNSNNTNNWILQGRIILPQGRRVVMLWSNNLMVTKRKRHHISNNSNKWVITITNTGQVIHYHTHSLWLSSISKVTIFWKIIIVAIVIMVLVQMGTQFNRQCSKIHRIVDRLHRRWLIRKEFNTHKIERDVNYYKCVWMKLWNYL